MQMPHPHPVKHQLEPVPFQPVLQPSSLIPEYQSSPSFQPVLQPYQHVIQATPQPASTPTATATATATATSTSSSGNSQVGARGPMLDIAGPSAHAGVTLRSDTNNESFGLGNISFGTKYINIVTFIST